jgi:hypothetical protein
MKSWIHTPSNVALVLDGVLEADGLWRVCAHPCRVTQAGQVGPEAGFELPRNAPAVRVVYRPVQQTWVVGLFPRIEQFARLNSWLDGARVVKNGPPQSRRLGADDPRSEDDRDDEKDLNSDPTGQSQRNHPACAPMLRSRTPQLVRFPLLAAVALGGRSMARILARRWVRVQGNDRFSCLRMSKP